MNQAHIHLLITHLPIVGSLLGAIVLLYGLLNQNAYTYRAAYLLLFISSGGALVAYFTGEGAEEVVEDIAGVAKSAIDAHEAFALYAILSLSMLGVVSFASYYMTVKNTAAIRTFAKVTLVIALISFGLVARTGYLGGQIRHTEMGSPATGSTENDD
jgi:uncharacterized membrane protein